MTTNLTTYRPGMLGRNVFDDIFDSMLDFPALMNRTTKGYPIADIFRDDDGNTVMEFALAGFDREDLNIEIKPETRTITISAECEGQNNVRSTRIARRNFKKTYVNYDNNLDLAQTSAEFKNGLLRLSVPTRAESKPLSVKIS